MSKSRVNWQTVCSDVAQMPWGVIVCSPVMVYVFRSPSTDDCVYDCLLESMGRIQSQERKSAFCFVGDFNGHNI